MGGEAYLKKTRQRPPALSFGEMERVSKPYIETRGGPS